MNYPLFTAFTKEPVEISVSDGIFMSLLGIALVFLVLAFLAFFIWALGKIINGVVSKKKTASAAISAPVTAPLAPPAVTLNDVSEKDAAIIMAIVASNSGIPLERLDFKSISLIKE